MSTTINPRSRRLKTAFFAAVMVAVVPVFAGAGIAGAHTSTSSATPGNDSAHPWKSNGCGPSGAGLVIPDSMPGIFNFNHPCDHHDGCYGGSSRTGATPYWVSRQTCDSLFKSDMIASCKWKHGSDLNRTWSARRCAGFAEPTTTRFARAARAATRAHRVSTTDRPQHPRSVRRGASGPLPPPHGRAWGRRQRSPRDVRSPKPSGSHDRTSARLQDNITVARQRCQVRTVRHDDRRANNTLEQRRRRRLGQARRALRCDAGTIRRRGDSTARPQPR